MKLRLRNEGKERTNANLQFCSQSRSQSSPVLSPSRVHEVRIPSIEQVVRAETSNIIRTGKLTKNLNHLAVNFSHPKSDVIQIELHHGARKNVATLRTVRTLINNLIIGVTKGFKYKMRYVYAHFPINVNVDKNSETGLYEVEIRYVAELPGMG